jgi:HK97 family phage major capsid protein
MTEQVAINETIDKLGRAFEEFKSANDVAILEAKKGSVTPEQKAKLDKIDAELDKLGEIKTRLEEVELKAARPSGKEMADGETQAQREYREAFVSWMRNPADHERQAKVSQAAKGLETRAAATVTSTGSAGGFALPEQIERTIARLSRDISPIRQIATVRTVGTPDYKELFDINGAATEWVGESGTRSQTNTPDLAEVAPTFGMLSARPRASEESLDDLFFDVESWLQLSVAEAFAAAEGAAFVSGNGTNRPTGFLAGPAPLATADASRAFGTLQYLPGGQAAAMPTSADVFLDMIYALRARYRNNARWVTSKAILSTLRKYKDTTNAYLWQPSLVAGQPDSFMGYQIAEAEDMPAVGANAFPLAFGDFREGYLIADRVSLRVTRDDITVPGFVQWYIRKRLGGRLRNTEAIKLLKISTT